MRLNSSKKLILAPTDLSNYLGCHHLTNQDISAAAGTAVRPIRYSPVIEALRERGLAHEAEYKQHLIEQKLEVVHAAGHETLDLMKSGVDVIYQARLGDETWSGIADFLVKVHTAGSLGDWSYEAIDTKLAKETKGGTVLQLCVYSFLLSKLQGVVPERMHVITPGNNFLPIEYRVAEYAAYFRLMESGIVKFLADRQDTYPEKVAHCDICSWWPECETRRRADDHLCYVAGITSRQIKELDEHGVSKLGELAGLDDIPAPSTGTAASLTRVRDQARIQLLGRTAGAPKHEVKQPFDDAHGFRLLPEPTTDDIYLDFEGDHFAEDGVQEYLTGYVTRDEKGNEAYTAIWAQTHAQEQQAFEQFIDFVTATLKKNPNAHIYHFAPYEQTALKRLMGRYATRGLELDELLRGEVFVDLHSVVKRSLIASVESYSIKNLEAHYGFKRNQDLRQASISRRIVESAIENGGISADQEEHKRIVEQYNRDDCVSMIHLQAWLERLRAEAQAEGHDIPRPDGADKEPPAAISEFAQKLQALRDSLLEGVPAKKEERTRAERARFTLAHILEFHLREDKATWWEKFRVLGLEPDDLEHERRGILGLTLKEVVNPKRAPIQRYIFPAQELDARKRDEVFDLAIEQKIGNVVAVNYADRTIDIEKLIKAADIHPSEVVLHNHVSSRALQLSLIRLAESVIEEGFKHQSPHATAINLLLVQPVSSGAPVEFDVEGETTLETACRLVTEIKGGVLAIQGPPGTGKTFTAGHMICACKQAGLKVGVTAVSHAVITNLLEETMEQAEKLGVDLSVVQRQSGEYDGNWGIVREHDFGRDILEGLNDGSIDVAAATAWGWARPGYEECVDVLFVDEAGQMALGNTLAAAQGGKTLVLLGDPQQLEQPTQSSHPEQSDVSALEYFLDGEATMPEEGGLFLEHTYRLHPSITTFTSEVYYEGRLASVEGLENQAIIGSDHYSGSGLIYVPVKHKGNTSKSSEEVEVVAGLVDELLDGSVLYRDKEGREAVVGPDDILIVAPYNAQVAILSERLAHIAHRIGTVNKFQGKGAPVVIYSMTSSSPEDAPRGMEFLYDPHRLNVASSRAKAMCILVGALALFEPDCGTPRQMKMANGLCRFGELARVVGEPTRPKP